MKELFKRLIKDSQQQEFGPIVPRDYEIPMDSSKIVSLIGIRRSGKTYLLYALIQKLRLQVNPENIIYINFEDDRLFPIGLPDLDALLEAYYELYPDKRNEKVYVFFDEVQNVKNWEKYVRRIYDTLNLQLFITGSSSKLMAKEIATSLRGRTITYEVFPFSFKEYLRYQKIELDFYSSGNLSFIKNAFNTYLVEGGFAETFNVTKDIQKRILKDYLDLIIYKDVVERYAIKNQLLLKHLIKYLFTNVATLISFNKLYNDYKSMGHKVGKDTLYEYISYLQEAYAVFTAPIFRNSVKDEQRNPRKIYGADNGFRRLFTTSLSPDYGKLYENIAFLHLRRQTNEVFYYKRDYEVDLYSRLDTEYLINVSYQINDQKTRDREIRALLEGMEYFNLQESYLVTSDVEETVNIQGKKIQIIPMWKWLLTDL